MKIEEAINQSAFENPAQKAIINVIYTHNHIQSIMRDLFLDHEITQQQYNVLRILRGKHPAVVNPSYIKSVMLDKNPDLTRLCDRLHKQGLIQRKISKENRRKMDLKISEKGLALLKTMDLPEKTYFEKLKTLTNEEFQQLSDLLDKLRG